ncbi:unnamed protein product, partial [Phaeothamnion confervicola]
MPHQVGAFFVAGQELGTDIYLKVLPSAGSRFIDKRRLPEAILGLDLSAFRAEWWASGGNGSPSEVISLGFLLDDVCRSIFPLDWEVFWRNNARQPLCVVVSGLYSMTSHVLSSRSGHFSGLDELLRCMRASMLVPGLTGPPVPIATLPTEPAYREDGAE